MGEFVNKMQVRLKSSSMDFGNLILKLFTGVVLGLTLALIIHEILGKKEGEGLISFYFIVFSAMAVFMRVSRRWKMGAVLIFDLICVLVALILRLYIMVAPGA